MINVFLGLGSNIGKRKYYLECALRELAQLFDLSKVSSLYETEPVGDIKQRYFLNAVLEIRTSLKPRQLLYLIKGIEAHLGRKKRKKWGPREIDIDILFYGNKIINNTILKLPHPEILKRRFVLEPLVEIAPRLIHPLYGKTVKQLLQENKFHENLIKIAVYDKKRMKWV